MKFTAYKNTATAAALNWAYPIHEQQDRGYGYKTDTHFVHFYGSSAGIWPISPGLCVTQGRAGTIADWQTHKFGATAHRQSILDVGETIATVWRPGIEHYDDIRAGLNTTDTDRHQALQSLRLLLERLDDLFIYIEPTQQSLQSYSHKSRELLILACTEVENAWTRYLREGGATPANTSFFTTADYFRLLAPLHLAEYRFTLKAFPSIPAIQPFAVWTAAQPTQSLAWYHAYNQTKHDRHTHFDKATIQHCIAAVAANLVLFSTRFSPYPLWYEGGPTSAMFIQLFDTPSLVDPKPETFYVPLIQYPANPNLSLRVFDAVSTKLVRPWTVKPFTL